MENIVFVLSPPSFLLSPPPSGKPNQAKQETSNYCTLLLFSPNFPLTSEEQSGALAVALPPSKFALSTRKYVVTFPLRLKTTSLAPKVDRTSSPRDLSSVNSATLASRYYVSSNDNITSL